MVMFADNLSVLGVSATQLDNKFDTQSYMVQWLPTTGEFGLYGTFGDYDNHQKVATRLAAHYTHSLENKQEQPGTNAIENSQIRLSDGSVVFTPDLFGPGISVETVNYQMMSLDAGIKYHGLSLEGEYYRRWLTDFTGLNTAGIADMTDNGYQLQSSAMVIQKTLQVYLSGSQILWPIRRCVGASRRRELVLHQRPRAARQRRMHSREQSARVGYTAVSVPGGGNGNVFHLNLEMNF